MELVSLDPTSDEQDGKREQGFLIDKEKAIYTQIEYKRLSMDECSVLMLITVSSMRRSRFLFAFIDIFYEKKNRVSNIQYFFQTKCEIRYQHTQSVHRCNALVNFYINSRINNFDSLEFGANNL